MFKLTLISTKNGKTEFLFEVNPKASFTIDMSDEEITVMQHHVAYWKPYVKNGILLVLRPVFDPKGGYWIAVVTIEDEKQLESLIANDPANGLNQYEVYPMLATSKYID